ncbi:hypothetical protein MSAN_01153200 [Mycena sanguinolenta]|uniref:Uncharacterized protein n=1 Tax=Mycena sanguinolenta TaxID=230812 RepID=A0A8H7D710_9AGAR|nr:hypothetical protein MSAN_01153200 [Mycena sanguinolenta]
MTGAPLIKKTIYVEKNEQKYWITTYRALGLPSSSWTIINESVRWNVGWGSQRQNEDEEDQEVARVVYPKHPTAAPGRGSSHSNKAATANAPQGRLQPLPAASGPFLGYGYSQIPGLSTEYVSNIRGFDVWMGVGQCEIGLGETHDNGQISSGAAPSPFNESLTPATATSQYGTWDDVDTTGQWEFDPLGTLSSCPTGFDVSGNDASGFDSENIRTYKDYQPTSGQS